MKADFTQKLKGLEGKPMREVDQLGKSTEVTLSHVCTGALVNPLKPEEVGAVEKILRWDLGKRIVNNKECNLTEEEVVLLRKVVKEIPHIQYVGAAMEILEPKSKN